MTHEWVPQVPEVVSVRACESVNEETISFVKNMKTTDHVILFYDTLDNKYEILFNFVAAGLAKRNGTAYICSEETPTQIRAEMEAFGIGAKKVEKEDILMILNYDKFYIENGQVEHLKILAHLKEIYEKFRKKDLGFRATGEMKGFFTHNKVKELLRYEYALHKALAIPAEAICAYSIPIIINTGYTEVIMPLIRAHGWSIFTGPAGSTVCESENVEDTDIEKLLQIDI